jgi:flagellar hook-associated protein 3 FlgL
MAIVPLQLARVSQYLRTNIAQGTLSRTQQSLLEVQNELSTGKRLTVPSDDPGDATLAQQLRKTLESRIAYADNLRYASSHLSEVDSTMSSLTDLLRQAQTIASANVGSDVTADQRKAAAAVVENLYNQAMSLGNRQVSGTYLFAGDKGNVAPFAPEFGGMRFVGSEQTLSNTFDESMILPFMVDGNEVFGALSTRVRGAVDLAPDITTGTRLADLSGATNEGIRLGSIFLSNGVNSSTIDLSNAATVGDVIDAINAAAVGGITASIAPDGNSFLVSAGVADDITITEIGGGTTATDLGIVTTTPGGAGTPVNGLNLNARVTPLTRLADLNGGAGIDVANGLVITNGPKSATVTFTGATTVEDLLNKINTSGTGVLARINDAGTGIDLLNPIQGLPLTIGENGGTTAADLGIRSFDASAKLADLNNGRGVRTVATGDDLSITRRDGTTFAVDLTSATTVQDVIDAINTADAGGGVTASFAAVGNGIVLTDSTGGAGTLAINAANFSAAIDDLGLRVTASGNTLTGTDVHPVEAQGLFANLGRLRDALLSSNQSAITTAAEGLSEDLDRVVPVRGEVAARVKDFETRQDRLDDQNVATRALLSSLEDTDYNEAITRFTALQTALQAQLMTTSRTLSMSLLDFLQ